MTPMRKLRALSELRLIRPDQRGSTIIEFAMLAPVMILLICGGIEYGHLYLGNMNLEGVTNEAARTAIASQERSIADRDAAVRTRIQEAMAGYPLQEGKQLEIQIKSYEDFAAAGTPEPFTDVNTNGRYDPPASLSPEFAGEPFIDKNSNGSWDATSFKDETVGGTGEVVSYTVTYPAAFLFEFLRPLAPEGVTLKTTVVARNEPVVIASEQAP